MSNVSGSFGVEITEFYFSHSEARVRNIPGYVGEIIERKKYRHKDDIDYLEVREFTVLPHDNRRPSFKAKAILHRRPHIHEYVKKISDAIEQKNKHFEKYAIGLKHVNLIIFDHEDGLLGEPNNMFYPLFFQPELEKVLLASDFREIYFITRLGEFNTPKRVYVPLRMVFLLAEICRFHDVIAHERDERLITYAAKRAQVCAEYLAWRGAKKVFYKDLPDGFEVIYGNSGVIISKDKNLSVNDYSDSTIPEDFNCTTPQEVSNFFDNGFLKLFEESKRSKVFKSELCFPIGGENQKLHPHQ